MSNQISDNKRIAKNAIFLYVRMIVIMAISLFTTRETLRILGIEEYGLYNVVAGVVVLLAFLKTSLIRASQRYLSYDIGKGDVKQIAKTFSMSVNANLCISLVVIFLAETVGLWFVNTYLKIPEERYVAANIVYQLSILTFLVDITRVTFNSAIISYERMSFYAYISVVEAILKLLVVYFLSLSGFDKLLVYSFLLLCVSLVILVCYILYCYYNFQTCRYHRIWDKNYFYELVSFSGWSMLTGVANISARQGGNIVLNIFIGLLANASYGIANQVSHAVYSFSQSFQTAFSPQITKLYAANDKNQLYTLIFRSSLASYYLMLLIAIPFTFKMDSILGLWLNEVPKYAAGFCIWMMIYELIDAFQSPLIQLVYSTGRIKVFMILQSVIILLNLPLSIYCLYLGMPAYTVLAIRVLLNVLTTVVRVKYIMTITDFPLVDYLNKVVARITVVTVLSLIASYILSFLISSSSLIDTIMFLIFCALTILTIVAFIGFTRTDRNAVFSMLVHRIIKRR